MANKQNDYRGDQGKEGNAKKIVAVDKPSVGVAKGDVVSIGLAGAAVSALTRILA